MAGARFLYDVSTVHAPGERGGSVVFRPTFYRIDPETGEFRIYGLRDGFRMSTTYTTNAPVVELKRKQEFEAPPSAAPR